MLCKITTECTFSVIGALYKQLDGVSIVGKLSVILSDCFVTKMERDVEEELTRQEKKMANFRKAKKSDNFTNKLRHIIKKRFYQFHIFGINFHNDCACGYSPYNQILCPK